MALFTSRPDLVVLISENIANEWRTLVPNAAGQGEKFFAAVEQRVKEAAIPSLTVARKEVESTAVGLKGSRDDVRVMLLLQGDAVPFNSHPMLVGAFDFGKHLILVRYVRGDVHDSGLGGAAPFVRAAVSAFLSLTNGAVMEAAKQFTGELGLDFAKINGKSEGIIDIV